MPDLNPLVLPYQSPSPTSTRRVAVFSILVGCFSLFGNALIAAAMFGQLRKQGTARRRGGASPGTLAHAFRCRGGFQRCTGRGVYPRGLLLLYRTRSPNLAVVVRMDQAFARRGLWHLHWMGHATLHPQQTARNRRRRCLGGFDQRRDPFYVFKDAPAITPNPLTRRSLKQ